MATAAAAAVGVAAEGVEVDSGCVEADAAAVVAAAAAAAYASRSSVDWALAYTVSTYALSVLFFNFD